ncbi:SDR family NAD(P)-dependent oxidoreductase [Streptomyces sp. NBC_01477]|uniref:SDR family NAD(P)-dependent oxidoreductase n=1 Tax=Streptomyces sp. NBC_01477 TaxID=2976015 RepID=UPI002E3703E8|nr:SDR family oxidoreductase [Streptomyces sp. NBC_01477]
MPPLAQEDPQAPPERRRTALVVGGSQGIGRAAAAQLAKEGWTVWTAARRPDPLPAGTAALCVDVRDGDSVRELRGRVGAGTDGLDLLVVTAGGAAVLGRMADITPDDVAEMLAQHVVGAYRVVRAFHDLLAARRGQVVLMLSRMGRAPRMHGHAYGTAKAALEHLAGCLALDLAAAGVRVNCVSPGAVDTAMFRTALPDRDPRTALPADDVGRLIVRLTDPEFGSLNGAVLDLPGDPASRSGPAGPPPYGG